MSSSPSSSSPQSSSSVPLVGPVGPEGPMRVVLLDSSGPLHRCYHGYADERVGVVDGKRMDVAAVYGYCVYIRTLARQLSFDRLIHVLDSDGGSVLRYSMFPEYKANRPPTPPLLAAEKALLPSILRSFGHAVVQKHGFEADDLIATLALRYAALGHEVLVISQDKDLMQLVEDGKITLARYTNPSPTDKHKTHAFYEEADVMAKFGVRPDQVVDWLALVGDTADNIPGAFKVGAKTASNLLNEYGSLAAVMTNAASLKGALGKNIMDALPLLPMYRRLTQTIIDVEIADPVVSEIDHTLADAARAILSLNCPDDLYGDILDTSTPAASQPQPQPTSQAPILHTPQVSTAAASLIPAADDDDSLGLAGFNSTAPRPRGP